MLPGSELGAEHALRETSGCGARPSSLSPHRCEAGAVRLKMASRCCPCRGSRFGDHVCVSPLMAGTQTTNLDGKRDELPRGEAPSASPIGLEPFPGVVAGCRSPGPRAPAGRGPAGARMGPPGTCVSCGCSPPSRGGNREGFCCCCCCWELLFWGFAEQEH